MARMKFLLDAERCIECNACVTACKNEHEVPWGINRRRVVTINDGKPGERSISMACMRPAPPSARFPASTPQPMPWCCMTRTFASAAVIASTPAPSARHNIRALAISALAGRWISAPSALAAHRPIIPRRNISSMDRTVWPKASCRFALKCARPRRCSRVMVRSLPLSIANACKSAVMGRAPGVGARPIAKRLRSEG